MGRHCNADATSTRRQGGFDATVTLTLTFTSVLMAAILDFQLPVYIGLHP
jgi:hypothetical protein